MISNTLPKKVVIPSRMETVLVVDDHDPIRELVEVILCRNGYRVITARDGEKALRIARGEKSIDLLFTDLEMPGMRGDILVSRFAKLHPAAAVIVTSSLASAIETDTAYLFLAKPFGVAELRSGVKRALQRRPPEKDALEVLSRQTAPN